MEELGKTYKEFVEMNKIFMEKAGSGSKTAEGVAMLRFAESKRPKGERICNDPYAVHFISPKILDWSARNPEEAIAMRKIRERFVPGIDNAIVARVRYFDDFAAKCIDEGLEQLVILGAGYDTRAYRIEGLKNIKIFEMDHPATQTVKIEGIKKIFGSLPDHVTYIPADLGNEDFGQRLLEMGYDPSKKTLLIMEGLSYYLPPEVVDAIMSFITKNSGKGSAIIFDYFPQSVADGSTRLEVGRNFYSFATQIGEPLQFGIEEGMTKTFLVERGFSKIQNVTSEDYKRAYFHGVNKDRTVCSIMSIAHAVVE